MVLAGEPHQQVKIILRLKGGKLGDFCATARVSHESPVNQVDRQKECVQICFVRPRSNNLLLVKSSRFCSRMVGREWFTINLVDLFSNAVSLLRLTVLFLPVLYF